MNDLYFTAKSKKRLAKKSLSQKVYNIRHEVAGYHPSENEYISLSGEYLIKPQENARWRVMRYKGGEPPLMIYATLRAAMQ